ncbi:hypothetical protein DIURU_005177 [Diutina rugosa]|uniref:Mitochondrial 15S rRNA processing factor CCM1 n=1 Tax=Diutina rugosa TaxID=5481 RepID=A0A642UEH4_DIURU|nr:uncharacterized protein DIURU_005177 [Diutina rugosa]KAA8897578.1 hypothetical protein DIURU_005177 [Diutina rugosa]
MLKHTFRACRQLRAASTASAASSAASQGSAASAKSSSQPPSQSQPQKAAGRKVGARPQAHYKLRSIAKHVGDTVTTTSDLGEAIDILDEGASYLREIEVAEKISDVEIYRALSPLANKIITRVLNGDVETGDRSIVDIVEVLAKSRVVDKYHFAKAATWLLRQGPENIPQVLNLWVLYLETKPARDRFVQVQEKYNKMQFDWLAYFALVAQHVALKQPLNIDQAKQLMQTDNLPEIGQVQLALRQSNLDEQYKQQFHQFVQEVQRHLEETEDPNGRQIYKRIRDAIDRRMLGQVHQVVDLVKRSSVAQNVPIHTSTIWRLMDAYTALDAPDYAISLFQELLAQGYDIPERVWSQFLICLSSPSRVKSNRQGLKEFDTAARVYLSKFPMTPRVLSIISSGYTNYDDYPTAKKLIDEWNAKGIELIHPAKNNVVFGLVLNKHIVQAEALFKQFTDADPTYQPSTTLMNSFLAYYAKAKNFKAVEHILKYMDERNVPYDVATYTSVVDSYFKEMHARGRSGDVDQVLQTIKGVDVNDVFLNALVSGLARQGNIESARAIFATAINRFPGSRPLMGSMLSGELDHGSIDKARAIFDYIKHTGGNVNVRDYNQMISGLMPKHAQVAWDYYQEMKQAGIQPNQYTWYFLLHHTLHRTKDATAKARAQQVLDDMQTVTSKDQLGVRLPKMLRGAADDYNLGTLTKFI